MGAPTISRDKTAIFDKSATKERRIVDYTGSTGYATNGDPITPEQVNLGKIEAILGLVIANAAKTQLYGWFDAVNKKIIWNTATGTEVGNGTDISGYSGRIEIIGR